MNIDGQVDKGFEAVKDAFAANFEKHEEVGAGFCLYVNGRKVVDIWGGTADVATSSPYTEDSLQVVFSTTKGATAVCAHTLVERGDLDLDAPVKDYWPEFAAAGKDTIPVRMLLNHQAGLPAIRKDVTLDDVVAWDPIVEALAEQEPYWEPGTAHGYHALTYGYLVGEVIKRITGQSPGSFFAKEVAEPLGLEFWIGLPEEYESRVAPLIQMPPAAEDPSLPEQVREMMKAFTDPSTLTGRALNNPKLPEDGFNLRAVHAAEMPAANGITNARSLARMYAATIGEVDGVRLLKPETVERARQIESDGPDRVLFLPSRFGLGFMLDGGFTPLTGPGSYGHAGAGGSLGFAHPELGIGYGYVMNKMQGNLAGDPRTLGLIDAVKASLG